MDPETDHRNGLLRSAWQNPSVPVQATISDDRSRGSEFDSEGRVLFALKQPTEKSGRRYAREEAPPSPLRQQRSSMVGYVEDVDKEEEGEPIVSTSIVGQRRYRIDDDSTASNLSTKSNKNHVDPNAFINRNVSLDNALHLISSALSIQDGPTLTIEALQAYALDLRSQEKAQQAANPRVQLVHRVLYKREGRNVKKHMYLDQPMWLEGQTSPREALAGHLPLSSVSPYLSNHPEVCCILYRDYNVASIIETEPLDEELEIRVKPKHTAETIEVVTARLATALAKFLDYYSFKPEDDITAASVELPVPYIAFYHTRGDDLITFSKTLENKERVQFQALLNCIVSQYENEYNLVDYMISKGRVTQAYIRYLFKPGDIIVQGKDQNTRGYMCKTWLDEDSAAQDSTTCTKARTKFGIKAWSWDFDGGFSKQESTLSVQFDDKHYTEEEIKDLSIRPLRYVDEFTKTRLKIRGQWFWKCRVRRVVSYEDTLKGLRYSSDDRYMVDAKMYHELHTNEYGLFRAQHFDPEAMKQEEPPDKNFIYLAPLIVKAYNLKKKKWVDLQLDGLREVSWNTRAFESLVIKEKTKRLIQALISNQIEAEKGTDLISGKGNGLILLLHGGPGTGKTLTAESVAEIAKKPLYPVTCGDIGTNPEDVEKYLESVLHLGKTWECVVLLDEADVFLEQRSLADLQRNALVSVFLRVLEYYDGILILTSNRVGTFDDAFKSRIQLAVHYNSLTTHQRTKIWGNFIQRLKELNEEGVDFLDLEDNIEQLASRAMNGREISNAITTARQYARWERQQDRDFKLNYKVMREVIETAGEFDEYINTLNGGLTQEQLATEEGLR